MPGSARDSAPVRRVTVRFTARSHSIIEDAAAREGVPFAQYVREAALARVAWELGTQSGDGAPKNAAQAARALRDGFAMVRRYWNKNGEG